MTLVTGIDFMMCPYSSDFVTNRSPNTTATTMITDFCSHFLLVRNEEGLSILVAFLLKYLRDLHEDKVSAGVVGT